MRSSLAVSKFQSFKVVTLDPAFGSQFEFISISRIY